MRSFLTVAFFWVGVLGSPTKIDNKEKVGTNLFKAPKLEDLAKLEPRDGKFLVAPCHPVPELCSLFVLSGNSVHLTRDPRATRAFPIWMAYEKRPSDRGDNSRLAG